MASVEHFAPKTDDELLFDAAAWVAVGRFLGKIALEHEQGDLAQSLSYYLGNHALTLGMLYRDTPARFVPAIDQWPAPHVRNKPAILSASGMITTEGVAVPALWVAHHQYLSYGYNETATRPTPLGALSHSIQTLDTHSRRLFEQLYEQDHAQGKKTGTSGMVLRAIHRDASFYIGLDATGGY